MFLNRKIAALAQLFMVKAYFSLNLYGTAKVSYLYDQKTWKFSSYCLILYTQSFQEGDL